MRPVCVCVEEASTDGCWLLKRLISANKTAYLRVTNNNLHNAHATLAGVVYFFECGAWRENTKLPIYLLFGVWTYCSNIVINTNGFIHFCHTQKNRTPYLCRIRCSKTTTHRHRRPRMRRTTKTRNRLTVAMCPIAWRRFAMRPRAGRSASVSLYSLSHSSFSAFQRSFD